MVQKRIYIEHKKMLYPDSTRDSTEVLEFRKPWDKNSKAIGLKI